MTQPANRTKSGKFKKGVSGNLSGRPALTEEEKIIKKMTKETFNDLCQKMMSCSKEDLEDLVATKMPYEAELFIRHMLSLGEDPDWHAYAKYLERRIGKVKDEIEITALPKPTIIKRADGSEVELGAKLEEIEE